MGKHSKTYFQEFGTFEPLYEYETEKKLLRLIAAFLNINGSARIEEVKNFIEEIDGNLGENFKKDSKIFQYFISSYFYMYQTTKGESIDFIHKSFKEYFLAEYYYLNVRDGKQHMMYAGIPSKETVEFLEGLSEIASNERLLELLKENGIETEFFDHKKAIENAKRFVEDRALVLWVDGIEGTEHLKRILGLEKINALLYGWLYRWISLCSIIEPDTRKDLNKRQVISLIKNSINVPYWLKKLQYLDLSGTNLTLTHLEEANLQSVILKDANLWRSTLRRANLWKADLRNTNLKGADLREANLERAKLERADLRGADLRRANLSGANLRRADLRGANLTLTRTGKTPVNTVGIKIAIKDIRKMDSLLRENVLRDNPQYREYLQ